MPEGIEVEYYRRAAEAVVGRVIENLWVVDDAYVRASTARGLAEVVRGGAVAAVRRRGKLLVLDVVCSGPGQDCGSVSVGFRFGMTGRLVVDGSAPIDRLLYSAANDQPAHRRVEVSFVEGGSMEVLDPRRLGAVELEPDEGALGPDAYSLSGPELTAALGRGSGPLKSRLLDQARVAGIGNLICDEVLFRAGVSPVRPAGELEPHEVIDLAAVVRDTFADLDARGGAHTGDLQAERQRGGVCPLDGGVLMRASVGGRTTYWCPVHQR